MRILFVCRGVEQFGIGMLSALARRDGHTVGLLFDPGIDDLFFIPSGPPGRWLEERLQRRLVNAAVAFRPDIVAASCFSNAFPYLRRLLLRLRNAVPAYYVLGGIHASLAPEHALRTCPALDAVAVGEGERSFPALLRRLAAGNTPHDLPGFWFRSGKHIIRNQRGDPVTDLETLPAPDKLLFHASGVFRHTLAYTTSRGCPYACSFCQTPMLTQTFGPGRIRRLSPATVVDHLQLYRRQFSLQRITFQDDDFLYDAAWLEEFSARFRAAGALPYQCNAHPNSVSPERVALLCAGNCRSVCLGVQSGSVRLRRERLNRHDSDQAISNAVACLKARGLHVVQEMMFGIPGETTADVQQSVTLSLSLRPDNLPTFMYYPFRHTPLYDALRAEGQIDDAIARRISDGDSSYQGLSLFPAASFPPATRTAFNLLPVSCLLTRLPGGKQVARRLLASSPHRWQGLIRAASLPLFNSWQFRERLENLLMQIAYALGIPSPHRQRLQRQENDRDTVLPA